MRSHHVPLRLLVGALSISALAACGGTDPIASFTSSVEKKASEMVDQAADAAVDATADLAVDITLESYAQLIANDAKVLSETNEGAERLVVSDANIDSAATAKVSGDGLIPDFDISVDTTPSNGAQISYVSDTRSSTFCIKQDPSTSTAVVTPGTC